MKSDWTTKKLSEIADFNPKESIPKGKTAKKVAMEKLQPFCRDIPEFEMSVYAGGAKFRNGDTIMARITPCLENGKTAKVNIFSDGEVGFGSTEYIVFRAKNGITDPDYLYYLVCSPLVREPAIKSMVGSSGRQRVQTDVIQNLTVNVPPLMEQRKIGAVLRSLDDKIALNTAINDNLTQQAQAIFKAWFVDFAPFDYQIPTNWKKAPLGSIARISTDTFSPAKNPDIEVEHYSIPAFDEKRFPVLEVAANIKSNKYRLTKRSVLISKLNPNIKRIWRPYCLSNVPICSTEFIVYEPLKPLYRDFVYAIIDSSGFSKYLCSHTTGSTNSRQRVTPSVTLNFEIFCPEDSIIQEFCSVVTPLYDLMESNLLQIQLLSKTRDALLPRLMSGELDVSGIDL